MSAAPTAHVNRTIGIAVFPVFTYWIVLNCRWNTFVLENFGCIKSSLSKNYYKHPSFVDDIKSLVTGSAELYSALFKFEGDETYEQVDHVKVIVKQPTGHTGLHLTNKQAGALTQQPGHARECVMK